MNAISNVLNLLGGGGAANIAPPFIEEEVVLFGDGKPYPVTGQPECRCSSPPAVVRGNSIKETLRKLFSDHSTFTEFYIVTFLSSVPLNAPVLDRLLANQTEIGDYVGSVLGDKAAGQQLASLLQEHIKCAGDALVKLKSGDKSATEAAVAELFSQGNRVAAFLSSLSPSKLPLETVEKEFLHHNQHVVTLATLHETGKWDQEVTEFDAYQNHMLSLSDLISYALSS
jgi:hypothetical protein